MTKEEFEKSLQEKEPPATPVIELRSLWYDKKGDWEKAHSLIDHLQGTLTCWLHAYLHRKEGDMPNARYWYSMAGKTPPRITLEEEQEQLINHFTS